MGKYRKSASGAAKIGIEVCGYKVETGVKVFCTPIFPVDPDVPARPTADTIGVSALSADGRFFALSEPAIGVLGMLIPVSGGKSDRTGAAATDGGEVFESGDSPLYLLYGGTLAAGSSCCGATALALAATSNDEIAIGKRLGLEKGRNRRMEEGGSEGYTLLVSAPFGIVNGKWCQCMHSRFVGVDVSI